jgi:hypothetical protein
MQLNEEIARHGDMVQLDAIDGPGVAMECPAAEKTIQWMRFALRAWPNARFIGKTEDDTFVNLRRLEVDLLQIASLPNIMYGLMGICSMPSFVHAERSSKGHRACFLGSLERVGWLTGGSRALVQWNRDKEHSKCAQRSSAPTPFPTGPLMVASASLATTIFSSCAYLDRFFERGRAANRRTLCRGRDKLRSWASLIGDCAIGHWMSQCAREVSITIAHMTYTKCHHYATDAGGQGWVAPSNESIAVHWLKRHTGPSGPTQTEGGEWWHSHEATDAARGPIFPPLMWRYEPTNVLRTGRLLGEPLNENVHAWYARSCGVWHEPIREHVQRLKNNSGPFAGGDPGSWPFFGCHPSRGYPSIRWNPPSSR